MSVYKPATQRYYRYDFCRGGRRFHGTTLETDRRRAKALEAKLILRAEALIREARFRGIVPMSFDAAAGRYWDEVGQHCSSPEQLDAELERLVEMVGAGTPLEDIDDAFLADLVARRRRHHRKGDPKLGLVSNSTVNRSVTELLRRVLTRAKKAWKVALPREPHWRQHKLAEPKERVRELRYDEEDRLEGAEREEYRAPRLFAQITGLRRREVASLTWSQVDFEVETITVVGKGDKRHVLPITPELRTLLEPLRGHHPTAVFTYVAQRSRRVTKTARKIVRGQRYPITYEGLATHFRRALDEAGIADFRLHDLRHTAATRALRATGNLRLVQRMLAHSSPMVTARYAHADLADLKAGMEATVADGQRRRRAMQTATKAPDQDANKED